MADAESERLQSLRMEYPTLLTHLHFLQGLRFAVLGATLPLMAGLFNYYLSALPFVPIGDVEPFMAIFVAVLGSTLLMAICSVEWGIRLQTRATVARGIEVETVLDITDGTFAAMRRRITSPIIHRISGIINFGFAFGITLSFVLLLRAIWATLH